MTMKNKKKLKKESKQNGDAKKQQIELRKDQAHVGAQMEQEVLWQLKALATERRMKQNKLMREAVNDLFRKYKKPKIA